MNGILYRTYEGHLFAGKCSRNLVPYSAFWIKRTWKDKKKMTAIGIRDDDVLIGLKQKFPQPVGCLICEKVDFHIFWTNDMVFIHQLELWKINGTVHSTVRHSGVNRVRLLLDTDWLILNMAGLFIIWGGSSSPGHGSYMIGCGLSVMWGGSSSPGHGSYMIGCGLSVIWCLSSLLYYGSYHEHINPWASIQ